jgi:hypothetical protein
VFPTYYTHRLQVSRDSQTLARSWRVYPLLKRTGSWRIISPPSTQTRILYIFTMLTNSVPLAPNSHGSPSKGPLPSLLIFHQCCHRVNRIGFDASLLSPHYYSKVRISAVALIKMVCLLVYMNRVTVTRNSA